jgi:hypothetical protein
MEAGSSGEAAWLENFNESGHHADAGDSDATEAHGHATLEVSEPRIEACGVLLEAKSDAAILLREALVHPPFDAVYTRIDLDETSFESFETRID